MMEASGERDVAEMVTLASKRMRDSKVVPSALNAGESGTPP
jgi:hypothetical protein